jgi:hypothetical protein
MTQGRRDLRKSFYLFLSSLLGALLFLIIHRIIIFIILIFKILGSGFDQQGYLIFLSLDYLTLMFFLMAGGWYGIWLGMYWYKVVYEENTFNGIFAHLKKGFAQKFSEPENVVVKINLAKQEFEMGMAELEGAAKEIHITPKVIVPKRAVRKKNPKRAGK